MNTLVHVAHGVISSSTDETLGQRLNNLFQGLSEVVEKFTPSEAAIEEIFLNKNPNSTLKLGMARGVIMLVPAQFSLPIREYSPNKIKKTIVGTGHADKTQISQMVRVLLPKAGDVRKDAADALAVAICHAHHGFPSF